MANLFELAENMISEEAKEKWLKNYLAEPANFNKFMEMWLQKTAAESIKKNKTPSKPPRIE